MLNCFSITVAVLVIGSGARVILTQDSLDLLAHRTTSSIDADTIEGSGIETSVGTTKEKLEDCPTGWSKYNGYCYFVPLFGSSTFDGAKTICKGKGANLFVADSIEEYNTIIDDLYTWSIFFGWIGLTQEFSAEGPKWDQNTTLNFKELNWPMNSNQNQTRCAVFRKSSGFLNTYWKSCDEEHDYICKGTPAGTETCEDGWLRSGNSCYFYERKEKEVYSGAVVNCLRKHATMFTPKSAKEYYSIMARSEVYAHTWTDMTSEHLNNRNYDIDNSNWLVKPYSAASNGYNSISQCTAFYNGNIDSVKYTYFYPCNWKFYYICQKDPTVEISYTYK